MQMVVPLWVLITQVGCVTLESVQQRWYLIKVAMRPQAKEDDHGDQLIATAQSALGQVFVIFQVIVQHL